MILKIIGLGFVLEKESYLRDPWNILDFVIVMSSYLLVYEDVSSLVANGGVQPVITRKNNNSGGLSLQSLRAFRVLRPLRALTKI